MAVTARGRAANRSAQYRADIAAKIAAGAHRDAVYEAYRWLLSELAKIQRSRPQHAAAAYTEVADRLARLAAALPDYEPSTEGGGHAAA